MRVLLAPGPYTADLAAAAAAQALADGWRAHDPTVVVDLAPLSDDGPGGLQAAVDGAGLVARAQAADLVVTAVALLDGASVADGVVRGAAWAAQRAGRPCVALADRVLLGRRELASIGLDAAYATEDVPGARAATGAATEPAGRLAALATRVARAWTPRPA